MWQIIKIYATIFPFLLLCKGNKSPLRRIAITSYLRNIKARTFWANLFASSAAKVEISDLSNETSGTSFVELLRKKFRLETPLHSFQSLPLLRCRQLWTRLPDFIRTEFRPVWKTRRRQKDKFKTQLFFILMYFSHCRKVPKG